MVLRLPRRLALPASPSAPRSSPVTSAKIAAAERLAPAQRAKALGKLDIAIMKNAAPLAPMGYYNNLFFFSNRVDPRSLVYSPVYTNWSIPALELK